MSSLKNRQKRAAMNFFENTETFEAIENKIDLEEARSAHEDVEKNGTISWEDLKTELGL